MGDLDEVRVVRGRFGWVGIGMCLVLWSQSCGKSGSGDAADAGTAGVSAATSSGLGGASSAAGGASAGTRASGGAGTSQAADAGAAGAGAAGAEGPSVAGGGTGDTGGASACTGVTQLIKPISPVREFLIDTSASMLDRAPNSAVTKYEATRAALVQAFTDMKAGDGAGLIFFPNTQGTVRAGEACIVRKEAVPIAALDVPLRKALIDAVSAQLPSGSTPTHDAFRFAADTLTASSVVGDKYVVLLTDGAPTYALGCMGDGMKQADPNPLIEAVADALLVGGIRTFVIGSPGSEAARATLSQMATQGGTAPAGCSDLGPTYCHFDMTTASDLSVALNEGLRTITSTTKGCNYAVPAAPSGTSIDLSRVNVVVTDGAGNTATLRRYSDLPGACDQGWQLAQGGSEILLCPDTCEQVKADPGTQVELAFGCTNFF